MILHFLIKNLPINYFFLLLFKLNCFVLKNSDTSSFYSHLFVFNIFPFFSEFVDSQDVELDAILGELCALEDKLDREIMPKSQSANQALGNAWNVSKSNYPAQNQNNCIKNQSSETKFTSGHSRSNSGGGGTRPKFEIGGLQVIAFSNFYFIITFLMHIHIY